MRARGGAAHLPPVIVRVAAGLLIAAVIALLARRAHSLTASGALAATAVGTVCVAAGWSWGILLVGFFASSSALSRVGAELKERRTAGLVAKGGERDATQVLANGGSFALAAFLALLTGSPLWLAAGGGALAAAAADTWGTELGTLSRSSPRLITTGRQVPTGTSGGITALGSGATLAGALAVAALGAAVGWGWTTAVAMAVGGVIGATTDSLIGALWQGRRRCPACDVGTERSVPSCGTPTIPAGGRSWLDNDRVNAVSGVVGALSAALVWVLMRGGA